MSLISPVRPNVPVDTLRKVKEASFLDGSSRRIRERLLCNAGFEVSHDRCGDRISSPVFLLHPENTWNR